MQATDSAVRREITVNATPERAFEVFTERFDSWWPRSHNIGEADMATAVIDPEAGRWYEVGVDGSDAATGARSSPTTRRGGSRSNGGSAAPGCSRPIPRRSARST